MKKTTHPLNRSELLSIQNSWYQKVLLEFWKQQKKWDGEDCTADVLFGDEDRFTRAKVVAKSDGILAGREEAEFLLGNEGIDFSFFVSDGKSIAIGDKILEIAGDAKHVLKIERVLLNLLSRLSGIVTVTAEAKKQIPDSVLLCPTRKTLWGPIDKKSVAVSGGGTHRLGLFDAVLVKENHLALCPRGILEVVEKIQNVPVRQKSLISSSNKCPWCAKFKMQNSFWEIEIETEKEFLTIMQNLPDARPGVIMFDNFSPADIKKLLKNIKTPEGIYYEASGGIALQNITEYANTGVSALSCGFLTNAAAPVDFSMRIEL